MVPFVLPNVLLIAEECTKEEYIKLILPELSPVFKQQEPIQVCMYVCTYVSVYIYCIYICLCVYIVYTYIWYYFYYIILVIEYYLWKLKE